MRWWVVVAFGVGLCSCARAPALVPADGAAVHCGGQSSDAFKAYADFLQDRSPAVMMTYTGLPGIELKWFSRLLAQLEGYSDVFLIPQIGLALPHGSELAKVANGSYDAEIAVLVAGLKLLGRPAYVRVGYEFNGEWNNYPREPYRGAWEAIVGAWRKDDALSSQIAAVWDFSCDAGADRLDWQSWYPTNADVVPDWWGVNIFSGASLGSSSCVKKYVDAADQAGFAVMLGESTPRTYGALNAPWNLARSASNEKLCIAVSYAATKDGSKLVTWECSVGQDKLWRVNHDGYLVNIDGKCVGTTANSGTDEGTAVITECGGTDTGPRTLRWNLDASHRLVTSSGACLVPSSGPQGSDILISSNCSGVEAQWSFQNTSVGGGQQVWNDWFVPYVTLISRKAVKAFCYIDWFWPEFSNNEDFNWYNWGDCRLELPESSYVGDRWKDALGGATFINAAANRTVLCAELGC